MQPLKNHNFQDVILFSAGTNKKMVKTFPDFWTKSSKLFRIMGNIHQAITFGGSISSVLRHNLEEIRLYDFSILWLLYLTFRHANLDSDSKRLLDWTFLTSQIEIEIFQLDLSFNRILKEYQGTFVKLKVNPSVVWCGS